VERSTNVSEQSAAHMGTMDVLSGSAPAARSIFTDLTLHRNN